MLSTCWLIGPISLQLAVISDTSVYSIRGTLVQFMVLDQYNAVLKSCDANFMHGVEWCCGCVGVCFHLKHTIYSEHIYWSVLIEIERALYICALSPHFTVCDVHISV